MRLPTRTPPADSALTALARGLLDLYAERHPRAVEAAPPMEVDEVEGRLMEAVAAALATRLPALKQQLAGYRPGTATPAARKRQPRDA